MKLSVILCSHNPREDYLQRTLAALRAQTLSYNEWELLLVDNCSDVPLSERFDISWHPNARHLYEGELGKMNAWLLGMREAKGEIYVFVDDDNVLRADYLEQALIVAQDWPFVGAWGGSIVPEFECAIPDWCREHLWRLTIVDIKEARWSNFREGFDAKPGGAGMCIRRQVGQRYLEWCAMNKASKLLDRTGLDAIITGYGDMDLNHCAIDIGLGTGQTPRLYLTHLIPSSRLTLDYFARHAEGDAYSFYIFSAIRGLPIKDPRLSAIQRIKIRLHWLLRRPPRQTIEIALAQQRGTANGWKAATQYLKSKNGPTS